MEEAPVKLELIGRRQAKDTLAFIVAVQQPLTTHRVDLVLAEFRDFYSTLSAELAFLPLLPVTDLASLELSHLESIQQVLTQFFSDLCRRQDVLANFGFRTFFRLEADLVADPRPVLLQCLPFDRDFYPSCVQVTPTAVAVGLKERTVLSHFGKIWNLLDATMSSKSCTYVCKVLIKSSNPSWIK